MRLSSSQAAQWELCVRSWSKFLKQSQEYKLESDISKQELAMDRYLSTRKWLMRSSFIRDCSRFVDTKLSIHCAFWMAQEFFLEPIKHLGHHIYLGDGQIFTKRSPLQTLSPIRKLLRRIFLTSFSSSSSFSRITVRLTVWLKLCECI